MTERFTVPSPKRRTSAESFTKLFPYYAGFPESFVRSILGSDAIVSGSLVYDPWNGSGTTTAVASEMGYPSIGIDINPVMVIVAKARLLPRTELPSLEPLAVAVLEKARHIVNDHSASDPLCAWFMPKTAGILRSIERSICRLLIDQKPGWAVDTMSGMAATLYTALFSAYRGQTRVFRGSNPTWLKAPKHPSERIRISRDAIESSFLQAVDRVAALYDVPTRNVLGASPSDIRLADATNVTPSAPVDCILTSPPYCTRIDYTAATRIELAVLDSLLKIDTVELNRSMIGTTKVPNRTVERRQEWGDTCLRFLEAVERHTSKASSGYYLRTHLDYFDKMHRSVINMSGALRENGYAILILQDSYYKDVHNDVPGIISEMAGSYRFDLKRREDFRSPNCMSRINSRALSRATRTGAIESVLIFQKI